MLNIDMGATAWAIYWGIVCAGTVWVAVKLYRHERKHDNPRWTIKRFFMMEK